MIDVKDVKFEENNIDNQTFSKIEKEYKENPKFFHEIFVIDKHKLFPDFDLFTNSK